VAEARLPNVVPPGTTQHVLEFELNCPQQRMVPSLSTKLTTIQYVLQYRQSVSMACPVVATLPILVGLPPVQDVQGPGVITAGASGQIY
jgi:hypothetical protein